MARWYVEAQKGETWREVSRQFADWLSSKAQLSAFGWSEGDAVSVGDRKLYCFEFPDHHGDKISLFPKWAAATERLFGELRAGKVHFSTDPDLVVLVPPEKAGQIPPWLK